MNSKKFQFWAPWVLLVIILALWQLICTVFKVSEFIFPSPLRIATQTGNSRKSFWATPGAPTGSRWSALALP